LADLLDGFAGDPERKKRKAAFRKEALEKWDGKLSGRQFNAAWTDAVCSFPDRAMAGAPRRR
jgi:hypothetical protein